jgi:hypothetical protein
MINFIASLTGAGIIVLRTNQDHHPAVTPPPNSALPQPLSSDPQLSPATPSTGRFNITRTKKARLVGLQITTP